MLEYRLWVCNAENCFDGSSKGQFHEEKNAFLQALPELQPLPALPKSRGTFTIFIRRRNSRFKSQFRTKNTIYIQPKKTVERQDDDTT